jgi:3-deoxy-D-arabino-heptulosonate 7-phosphate (DAHP) synthase
MKKLIAAAVAALAIATPAQAQHVSQADLNYTKAILDKLSKIGVTISTPTICPKDLAGKYDRSTASLMICPVAMENDAIGVETIAHEAIHAAQHCVGGPLADTVLEADRSSYAKDIAAALRGKAEHVYDSTRDLTLERRVAEYEAYAFESSPELVLSILNKVCH